MFENRIPYAIKQDILDYFDNQKINLKNESEIYADYALNDYGEYVVTCVIKDRKETHDGYQSTKIQAATVLRYADTVLPSYPILHGSLRIPVHSHIPEDRQNTDHD